ncbi:ImmA/IrrE family metallo-endopeptidase [Brevibacillus sp. SYP-B805]|uniref:ImmA/IrrE family metallo-endopeptidase n=1 Tax=Brevibacillus sp. SYP-B805 TaxID=1578199 RepID=UPI0013ED5D83|nr:ImmA/IrrE family metallo-endopeptidase [Brevibacillus sp. SYP-B805]NGQ95056.1 ImmA/IrrE family metallo-endopeptidase [Brevibacillus sp. SYP-B805]
MVEDLYKPQTWLESQVYMLLKHHGIQNPEEIDLETLCATYRIEIWTINGRSRTHPHPSRPGWHVIAVDESLDPITRRLKIAHEFGHLVLHVGVQPDHHSLLIDWQEAQANHFVEHLLMPFYMFDRFAYKVTLYDAPKYIAQLFRVPERMAKQRFDRFLSRMYVRGYAHYI